MVRPSWVKSRTGSRQPWSSSHSGSRSCRYMRAQTSGMMREMSCSTRNLSPDVAGGGGECRAGREDEAEQGGIQIVDGQQGVERALGQRAFAAGAGGAGRLAGQAGDEVGEQLRQFLVVDRAVHGERADPAAGFGRIVAAAGQHGVHGIEHRGRRRAGGGTIAPRSRRGIRRAGFPDRAASAGSAGSWSACRRRAAGWPCRRTSPATGRRRPVRIRSCIGAVNWPKRTTSSTMSWARARGSGS